MRDPEKEIMAAELLSGSPGATLPWGKTTGKFLVLKYFFPQQAHMPIDFYGN